MKTFFAGFATLLGILWLLGGLVFGLQEYLAAVYGGHVAWSQHVGWWQFAIYGGWIIALLFALYFVILLVGEAVLDGLNLNDNKEN